VFLSGRRKPETQSTVASAVLRISRYGDAIRITASAETAWTAEVPHRQSNTLGNADRRLNQTGRVRGCACVVCNHGCGAIQISGAVLCVLTWIGVEKVEYGCR